MGKTIAILYDWAYDELGSTRKSKMIAMMEHWFAFLRDPENEAYQSRENPTGNYYLGNAICTAYMGYAIAGDSHSLNGTTLSQQMIDFTRQRILGTESGSLLPGDKSSAWFTQSIFGGLVSGASTSYNLNMNPPDLATYVAAPQKDGLPVQGWAYGGSSTNYLVDWCYLVKSCTGEDVANNNPAMRQYFDKTARALVHGYLPNRFSYEPANDNGASAGSVADYSMALRLAAVCEESPEGPHAQEFYKTWLKPVILKDYNIGTPALPWEKMLFDNPRAISTEISTYEPFYPIPEKNIFKSVAINSGLQKLYMRKDWSATSTWASIDMGAAVYDAHNHNNAGHFKIIRGDAHDGDDFLLIGGNEVGKGDFGDNGIVGETSYGYASSLSNTLYYDDFDTYERPDQPGQAHEKDPNGVGGQTSAGFDEPTHVEQNKNFSYFRADLTSAYYVNYYDPQINERTLEYYYRSFLYLRNSDIFLIYDNFTAKKSTSPKGEYVKHLRWHFMENPTINANGKDIKAEKDGSQLYVHTVLPTAIQIKKVNESNNPDDFTSDHSLAKPYNSHTWRAEVSVVNNPLKQDILTVMQPGALNAPEMKTTAIKSNQSNMEGSIVEVNGNTELVMFNSIISKYLTPITLVSYTYNGDIKATHTLCGLNPDKKYQVDYAASTVTVTEATGGNYTASPSGVLTFKLVPPVKTQTITFGLIQPVIYGTADFAPIASSSNATISITYKSSNPAVATIVSNKIHVIGVGTTNITASQAGDADYLAANDVIQPLAVNKAPLTITADAKTKIQGAANPALTVTYSGFVYGETNTILTVQPSITTTATTSSLVGDYPIKAAGATSTNYNINYVDGTLKITATAQLKSPNLSIQTNSIITYGNSDFSAGATSDNAAVAISYASSNPSVATIVNDKIHIVGAGNTIITANQAGNSIYSAAVAVQQNLTIDKTKLVITADAKTKVQGAVNPALTASYFGFAYNESINVLTTPVNLSTVATTSSTVGDYPIVASNATANNYVIQFINGSLKVTSAALTTQVLNIQPSALVTYGAADFSAGASSTNNTIGIMYTSSNTSVATIVNGKVHIVGAGTTTITASQPGNLSYAAAADVTQTLTVNKAPLTITADIQVKTLGSPNPPLTIMYSGFVYGETSAALSPGATVTTTASLSSPVGVYPINVVGAMSPNYMITYINSTMTISNTNQLPQVSILQKDIQNIISPNGDGINDFWIIKNIELYPDNNVKILDRLGRILYQKKGYDNTWDGKYNGKLLTTDAYYFLIDLGKNLSKFKGMVTVVER